MTTMTREIKFLSHREISNRERDIRNDDRNANKERTTMTREIKFLSQREISNEERDIRNDNRNANKESTTRVMHARYYRRAMGQYGDQPPPRPRVQAVIDWTTE